MAKATLDPKFLPLIEGRRIASLATLNADGSPHLTAVWYLYQDGYFFVATSSRSRKARNLAERPAATLMVEARKPGSERGVTATGPVEVISGEKVRELNLRIHRRYMSDAAIADPQVGGVFARSTTLPSNYDRVSGPGGICRNWTPCTLAGALATLRGTCCPRKSETAITPPERRAPQAQARPVSSWPRHS